MTPAPRNRKRIVRNERGQSTLEFALTAVLFIPFTLFFVQVSMVLGFANYAHYAVFMAARAYQSAGDNIGDQQSRAKDVIGATLKKSAGSGADRFPSIAKSEGGSDPRGMEILESTDPALDWQRGVRYTFRSKMFIVPLMGSGGSSGGSRADSDLVLTAESFLLREPTESECLSDMRGRNNGMYDNGC